MTADDIDENPDKPGKISRPSVPVIDSLTSMSIIERKLAKLFKCCFYRDRCFYTTDDGNSFLKHLNTCHKNQEVSCIYCFYQSGETEPYDQTERLIDHILIDHGLRLFQCNLCVYRGSSISHVLLHQANIHGNKYQTTITSDGFGGMCKVLVCKRIVSGPLPSETVYWSNCKVERIVNDANDPPKYQCLYCEFASFIPHVVFFHVCKVHPDYSLILFDKYVDQLPEIKETEEKTEPVVDDDDAELDAIVHDLHSIGTKDDDVDMSPVDDAPPEDLSDDNSNVTQSRPSTSELTRERLFALKGVRIAKKQPDPQPSGKAKKSTAKPIVQSEPDFDRDDEEDVPLTARQRIMRGYRPEQSAALFKPVALKGNTASNRNLLKCLICNDNAKLTKVVIESHLLLKHNTTSSFKCSECTFVGSIREITAHFKAIHGDSAVKFVKFIVSADETEEASIPMMSRPVRSDDPSSSFSKIRRKGQEKDPKNLSSKIKRSVFIGPKSWKERQKQQKGESTGQDSGDSEVEIELNQDEPEEMDIDMGVIDAVASGENLESDRFARLVKKRKASEMEESSKGPISIEELLTLKTTRERGSEYFFCLFCSSLSTKDFSEAQAHMKRHLGLDLFTCPECPIFECTSIRELKIHNENAHPTQFIPLPNVDENNVHINYITEFFNEQFIRSRKGDQMTPDQAARYARIICPICERANQLTDVSNFHFTKWRAFKTHFWKHANASFIKCLKCGALVPRTRKRIHLNTNHLEDLTQSAYDIKDFTPFYLDSLPQLALASLKSTKRLLKAFYFGRIKEEYEIMECRVILGPRIEDPQAGQRMLIKEEPIEEIDLL